jgi:LmbE family N-acetylglucosaminyl deacetylase
MMHWLWYTLPLVCVPGLEQLLGGACPAPVPVPAVRRVLAVAAHPDDLEYFCGGTLALLARQGARVTAVVATRGEKGGDPVRRLAEQEAAARVLGYSHQVLGFPDGGVRGHLPLLRSSLGRVLGAQHPDLVLTFDHTWPYPVYHHDDHMAVAETVSGLWQGPCWLFHTRRPTLSVEITDVFAAKASAFAAHRSQLPLRGTARLVGFHLHRRNQRGARRRYVELFRDAHGPPVP